LVFENGCIANVTASRIALKTERKVRVFSRQAYLSLDYFKKTGTVIHADVDNLELIEKIRSLKNVGKFDLLKAGWSDMVHYEKLQIDDKEPLKVEQESFLKAVADKSEKPEVTAKEGLAAVKCAQMILDSIKEHKWQ
jgi:predicted dehydrogenase